MSTEVIAYVVFGAVLIVALAFDLGLLTKRGKEISIRHALYQTFFWVSLALGFFIFLWLRNGHVLALEYLSAYLMEWSLSIDNIFVFILIFSSFRIKEKYAGQVLLIGILMAVVFRVIFITIGVALVARFHWILFLFGIFLLYTGIHLFKKGDDEEFDPHKSKIYRLLKQFLPLAPHDGDGKYMIRVNGKPMYTTLFVVIVMLAFIDIVFALDSIPAVMGITSDRLVIYTSNIFAVLGLRSLFFLLRGAVSKFDYLQQGIAIVLVFIGIKMLLPLVGYFPQMGGEEWINQWIPKSLQAVISLGVIFVCLSGSVFYSIFMKRKGVPPDVVDDSIEPEG